ncbi:hypothetical protein IHE44_0000760 [Lamprotornis superbus]|uniref:Fidgetin-like protein 1 n=1 Tax=Lamprotornis superbus TaxID=245042 RepID=A0A835NZK3_9PASS|nr:hypothetical protein IHE44_0000760 [Lamprotornis superbus]
MIRGRKEKLSLNAFKPPQSWLLFEKMSAMEAPTPSTVHLSEWQESYFAVTSGTCTPGQKADGYRAKILRIQYAWANSEISQVCAANLFKKYAEKYSAIIDSGNAETGLNNYAENILTLAKCQQSDSDKWQSALTTENVFELKCVRERMQAGKIFQSSQMALADARVRADKGVSASAAPALPKLDVFSSTRETELSAGSAKCASQGPDLLGHPSSSKSLQSSVPPVTRTSDILPAASASLSKQINPCFQATPLFGSKESTNSSSLKMSVPRQDGSENGGAQCKPHVGESTDPLLPVDERLKNIEPKMVELIMHEIMDHGPPVSWDDIAGVEFAKATIKEIVVWPMLRPDIFTGLRGPPKGILLFGPPGTGKTLIGKCIACQSGATFFSISASSLTSKWVGEGEKMVRALFAVARCQQPAVIFIDEIDSLLSQRGEGEHESSRRIKTEFLVQLDGATTSSEDRILVVGATNRPQEIDEAARRRLVKRLYIPLPEASAREQIVARLMAKEHCSLSEEEIKLIVQKSDGFSGADMTQLCREASLGPIRSLQSVDIATITPDQVRPICFLDFESALRTVRPSVSPKDLELYETWNQTHDWSRWLGREGGNRKGEPSAVRAQAGTRLLWYPGHICLRMQVPMALLLLIFHRLGMSHPALAAAENVHRVWEPELSQK